MDKRAGARRRRRRRDGGRPADSSSPETAKPAITGGAVPGVGNRPLAVEAAASIAAVVIDAPGRHPLVYAKRIVNVDPGVEAGATVAVRHRDGNLLGYGIYNPKSEIRVRLLSGPDELPDADFWNGRLNRAVALRRDLLLLDAATDAYRVVHAESDGFSGLVVDRYADILSAEAFSLGMLQRGPEILQGLARRLGVEHWTLRCGPQTLAHEGFAVDPVSSPACPTQTVVAEFGTRFRVRFVGGHKTGFFCDQRDNRRRLADFCNGRSVLDVCCYTGGFALQAKRLGQAAETTAVDLDETALAVARENANLNQTRIDCVHADAFAYMRDMDRNGKRYDVVVLDPPKLIRSRAEIEEGSTRHYDLNRLALALVRPGGLLLTCTCAGLLGLDEFKRMVGNAARKTNREVKLLAVSGAAADHPVALHCPETEYLKALWLQVER